MNTIEKRQYDEAVRDLIGDPRTLDSELQEFRQSACMVSSEFERLTVQYPDQWIGVYAGEVVAHAATLPSLISALESLGIPPGELSCATWTRTSAR